MLCVLMLMRNMSAWFVRCVVGNKKRTTYMHRKQRRIQRHIKISRKKPKNKMLKLSTRMSVTKFSLAAVRLEFLGYVDENGRI